MTTVLFRVQEHDFTRQVPPQWLKRHDELHVTCCRAAAGSCAKGSAPLNFLCNPCFGFGAFSNPLYRYRTLSTEKDAPLLSDEHPIPTERNGNCG